MSDRTAIVVLGIDGGGTRTRALIVDGAGGMLGSGEAGPSNLHVSGPDATRDAIASAVAAARVEAALRVGHLMTAPFDAAFLGLAGVVTERDHDEIRSIARELALAPVDAIGIDHDLRIALAGGLGGSPGIVLIAGTGSSCYGRTSDGANWRAGGWGPLLDDPGSGYWLGVRGMAAVGRAMDGRGPTTSLQRTLPDALGVADAGELLRMTGIGGLTRDRIAALAPLVLEAADAGDTAAVAIRSEGIDELALMVEAVSRKLFDNNDVELALTGGLIERSTFRTSLEHAIARRAPRARPVRSRLSPVEGAARLALSLLQ